MKTKLITLEVLKVSKQIGNRPIGSRFSEGEKRASVWIKLGLVKDVNAKPIKKKVVTKKVVKQVKEDK